jgi:hypothetical protein
MPDVAHLVVRGGDAAARSPLISVPLTLLGDLAGRLTEGVTLHDEESGLVVAAQLSSAGTALEWVVPGRLEPGAARRFTLRVGGETRPDLAVAVVQKLDRLRFLVAGVERARYIFLGARRPYWWPVLGPSGASVVRGQGSEDHPHHTGLNVAYGGHGEGGSANIWSDWDQGEYGPGGRMAHRGFRHIAGGAVYAEAVEDLTYLDADGEDFCEEVRRMRVWPGPGGALFIDLECRFTRPRDAGTHPFLLAARLPETMAIGTTGRVISPTGPRQRGDYPAERWVDGSGPVGEGGQAAWNGIAILDHPANHGYPGTLYKYAVMQQLSQCHYPPPERAGGTFTVRQRVYVHDGDAEAAHVEEHWAAYAMVGAAAMEG